MSASCKGLCFKSIARDIVSTFRKMSTKADQAHTRPSGLEGRYRLGRSGRYTKNRSLTHPLVEKLVPTQRIAEPAVKHNLGRKDPHARAILHAKQ